MDLRSLGKCEDGLESDPEPSDLRQALGALGDSADPANVGLIERYTKVRHAQGVRVKLE